MDREVAVPDLNMKPVSATDLRCLVVQSLHAGTCACAVCAGTGTFADLRAAEGALGPGAIRRGREACGLTTHGGARARTARTTPDDVLQDVLSGAFPSEGD